MTGILILAKGSSPRCDFLPPKNTHTTQQEALASPGGGFLFPFFSFSHKCKGSCGTGAAGRAALGAARITGDTLFREREYPPETPERKDEGSCPSTPLTLAVCGSKSCTRCAIGRGVRGFATNPYYSLPLATAPYYREARVTIARRRTACGRGIAALAAAR